VRVLVLNGPPGSGKSYLSRLIAYKCPGGFTQETTSRPLKEMAHALYGFEFVPFDFFEREKDVPQVYLFGKTWRQVYQDLSENYLKPIHGKRFFGERLRERLAYRPERAVVDCGFPEEVAPLIDSDMAEHVDVLRIRRPGKTFEGDTRKYLDRMSVQAELLDPSKVRRVIFHDFTNDGTDDENWNKLCEVLPWLG
jgi:hypothetical protein